MTNEIYRVTKKKVGHDINISATLKGQLSNTQHDNVAEAVHNKVQESVCKVSTMINVNLNFKKHTKKHHKNTTTSFSASKMSI